MCAAPRADAWGAAAAVSAHPRAESYQRLRSDESDDTVAAPEAAGYLARVETFIRCAIERERVRAVLRIARPAERDGLSTQPKLFLRSDREGTGIGAAQVGEDRELV